MKFLFQRKKKETLSLADPYYKKNEKQFFRQKENDTRRILGSTQRNVE